MRGVGFPKLFVGTGTNFPFEFSDAKGGRTAFQGSLSISDGVERIRQSLLQILYTNTGERPMRRGFGSDFRSFLFEPLDKAVISRIIYSGRKSIEVLEPRVQVDKFEISLIDKNNGLLQVSVAFRIRDTNEPGNLVFPFYLIDPSAPRQLSAGVNLGG